MLIPVSMNKIKEGDKVKCIDDCFEKIQDIDLSKFNLPVKNKIYTVREVVEDGKGVLLEGVKNDEYKSDKYKFVEPAIRTKRFKHYSK